MVLPGTQRDKVPFYKLFKARPDNIFENILRELTLL